MFVASAYANTTTNWFGMSASGTKLNLTKNATTNNAPIEVTGSKIKLENDADTKLVVAPTVGSEPAVSDGLVKITSTSIITPCPVGELPTDLDGVKAGFTIAYDGAVTNFYGYASSNWFPLSGAIPGDGETTFTVALDYRTHVASFYVGDTVLTNNNVTAFDFAEGTTNHLENIAVYGTGTIGSIATDCEVAVAAYNNVKYGSVAEAMVAAGQDHVNEIAPVSSEGTAETAGQAANGLQKWQCVALNIPQDAKIGLAPCEPAAQTDSKNILLGLSVDPEPGMTVTFTVRNTDNNNAVAESCPASAIKIPRTPGTYTIEPVFTSGN
jgi:hypothetical protein